MGYTYTGLAAQNIATAHAQRIVVTKDGWRIATIKLGPLDRPELGDLQYQFGLISDTHVGYQFDGVDAAVDLAQALAFLEKSVDFICHCGDATDNGTAEEWARFNDVVAANAPSTPIYAVSGNHEHAHTVSVDALEGYLGHPLLHTITRGDDVFIFLSLSAYAAFRQDDLQGLYAILEEKRNARCFVFQHYFIPTQAGDPLGLYHSFGDNTAQQAVITSLMAHYKNSIWIHGHSHYVFGVQGQKKDAIIDTINGVPSVHVPSTSHTYDIVDGERAFNATGCQGYVVQVYTGYVVLNGYDFVAGTPVETATYCLDTTLQTVDAGSYTDPTGTITT